MMSALYKEEGASLRVEILQDPAALEFIDTHAAILDSSFEKTEMSDLMRQRLKESDWMFSGMKTFHELNEAFPSLLDDKGDRKPFEQFLSDVRRIDDTYNRNYLRAEYNFAQGSAEMAARWEDFEADGDEYYLQYRTQNDGAVRPEHAALHGVTLPMSDAFWSTYYPPNGWNCRCTVIQVLKSKYQPTDHDEAMSRGSEVMADEKAAKMFAFNSGKEQRTFPAYNPYTISRCATCDKAKLNLASGIPSTQLCEGCSFLSNILSGLHENKARLSEMVENAENGKIDGSSIIIGRIDSSALNDVTSKLNKKVSEQNAVVTSSRVSHALRTSKQNRGAAVDKKEFIDELTNFSSMEIYLDEKTKDSLLMIMQHGAYFNKYVFRLDYFEKSIHKYCLSFRTAGKVDIRNLSQYTKIK